MDRTTVRIILLIIGVLVIAGIYLWHQHGAAVRARLAAYWPRRSAREDVELNWDAPDLTAPSPADADESFRQTMAAMERHYAATAEPPHPTPVNHPAAPLLDEALPTMRPLPLSDVDAELSAPTKQPTLPSSPPPPLTRITPGPGARPAKPRSLPTVIQLSVVAMDDALFNGDELLGTFQALGLRYGEMGIFHQYGSDGAIQFSIANLVEPGTFPINDMREFSTPGVVLFFQPGLVSDPLTAFDTLIHACREMAKRLKGLEWDATRQMLTPERIAVLRATLQ